MSSLTEFLQDIGAKSTNKQSEWLLTCWECGAEKLYFNVNKVIGYCVKCDCVRSLSDIAREVAGLPVSSVWGYIEEHRRQEQLAVGFKDAVLEGLEAQKSSDVVKPLVAIKFPPEYRSLADGIHSVIGSKALNYMLRRGFEQERLFRLGFGYCDSGYFANRVIIPFHEDGALVYYQARDFTGKVDKHEKVLNPALKHCPNGKTEVLFNYDEARNHDCIVINESWGSALATGKCAVGVNGSHLSEVQEQKLLMTDASTFMVLFDYGAEEHAWKTAERLHQHRRTFIGFLPYGDPNEVPHSVLINTYKSAKQYSKDDHLRFLARKRLGLSAQSV
jgi:hypothetical protein